MIKSIEGLGVHAYEQTKLWWRYIEQKLRGQYALAWFGVFSFAESIFIPFPVDPLMGVMVAANRARWWWIGLFTSITSTLGAACGYLIGAYGLGLIEFFAGSADRAHWFSFAERTFVDNTALLSFAAAFTPLPNGPVVIAAGVFGSPIVAFLAAWFVGRTLRFLAVAYVVYEYGERERSLLRRTFFIGTTVLAVMVLGVVIYQAVRAL